MDKNNQARLNSACVVCGTQNPKGLRIEFVNDSDGVCANWTPTEGWESFRGIVHGGIITTVPHDAMSKATISRDCGRAFLNSEADNASATAFREMVTHIERFVPEQAANDPEIQWNPEASLT